MSYLQRIIKVFGPLCDVYPNLNGIEAKMDYINNDVRNAWEALISEVFNPNWVIEIQKKRPWRPQRYPFGCKVIAYIDGDKGRASINLVYPGYNSDDSVIPLPDAFVFELIERQINTMLEMQSDIEAPWPQSEPDAEQPPGDTFWCPYCNEFHGEGTAATPEAEPEKESTPEPEPETDFDRSFKAAFELARETARDLSDRIKSGNEPTVEDMRKVKDAFAKAVEASPLFGFFHS